MILGLSLLIIFFYIIIGIFIGWIAGLITRGKGFGFGGNIAIAIIGTFLGRLIFSILGFHFHGFFSSIIVAIIGSVVLLLIVKALFK